MARSKLDTLLVPTSADSLALTPVTRELLRSTYERQPDLNAAERRVLASACRITDASVEYFWEDMNAKRRAYFAMRVYIARRELDMSRLAKKQGVWK